MVEVVVSRRVWTKRLAMRSWRDWWLVALLLPLLLLLLMMMLSWRRCRSGGDAWAPSATTTTRWTRVAGDERDADRTTTTWIGDRRHRPSHHPRQHCLRSRVAAAAAAAAALDGGLDDDEHRNCPRAVDADGDCDEFGRKSCDALACARTKRRT